MDIAFCTNEKPFWADIVHRTHSIRCSRFDINRAKPRARSPAKREKRNLITAHKGKWKINFFFSFFWSLRFLSCNSLEFLSCSLETATVFFLFSSQSHSIWLFCLFSQPNGMERRRNYVEWLILLALNLNCPLTSSNRSDAMRKKSEKLRIVQRKINEIGNLARV